MTMNVHFAYSPISGQLSDKQFRGKISMALLKARERVLKRLEEYVSTWDHKPVWTSGRGQHLTGYKQGDMYVAIATDDKVFWWLEEGTSVRYAKMFTPFSPKTAKRRIQSVAGTRTYKGGKYFRIDRNNPAPGIEPREVLKEIAAQEAPQFEKDILSIVANVTIFQHLK